MPTYAYECEKHGKFDLIQGMKEDHDAAPCHKCKQPSTRIWETQFFADGHWPRIDMTVKPDKWDKKRKEWLPKEFATRKQQEKFYKDNNLAQKTWGGEY